MAASYNQDKEMIEVAGVRYLVESIVYFYKIYVIDYSLKVCVHSMNV